MITEEVKMRLSGCCYIIIYYLSFAEFEINTNYKVKMTALFLEFALRV